MGDTCVQSIMAKRTTVRLLYMLVIVINCLRLFAFVILL